MTALEDASVAIAASSAEFAAGLRWLPDERALGSWTDADQTISWWVEAPRAGLWDVSLVYAAPEEGEAARVEVACGESRLVTRLHGTPAAGAEFVTVPVGLLRLPKGVSRVTVRALERPSGRSEVARLRELVLDEGFVPLFNGKDLEGWDTRYLVGEGYGVEDGALVCKAKGGGNLYTEKEYADFVLRFEFKLEECSNNGLGIRAKKHPDPPKRLDAAYFGIEVQILDNECPGYKDKLQPWQYHGSLYGVAPAKRGHLRPRGEWNVEEVLARGSRLEVRLNGVLITSGDIADAESNLKGHVGLHNERGYVGFLGHGTRVEFRNIRIKDLDENEK